MDKSDVNTSNSFCTYFQKSNINIVLLFLFCISIASVVIIKFDITDFKVKCNLSQGDIDKWNDILLEFSYGYISGYIFFFLTVTLPYILNKVKIRKGIYWKIESINRILKSILKGFAENTNLSAEDFGKANVKKIFSLKNWNEIDGESKLFGMNMSCIQACAARNRHLLLEIDSLINTYKEYLCVDIITMLEEMRNSRFIINTNAFSMFPQIDIKSPDKEGLAEEFSKMIDLYNDVEKKI